MNRLKNAPNMKYNKTGTPYHSLDILAGSEAWIAWNGGNGTAWQLLADADPERRKTTPIILGEEQLKSIHSLRLAPEDKKIINIFQFGELTSDQITLIALNIAKNTKAEVIALLNNVGERLENLSDYVARLRKDSEIAELIAQTGESEEPTIKDRSPTNEKARAFKQWLGLDLALQRGSGEIYAYGGVTWQRLDSDTLEDNAVLFFEENHLAYSDISVLRLINTLKMQLPKMPEPSSALIHFKNGTLNRNDLTFTPIKREDFIISYLDCDYTGKPEPTPHFDSWMNFVANGNEQKKTNILAGLYAVLTNRYDWQLFLEITGDGGSGKSVFAKIATMLVGNNSTTQARLEDMDTPRGRANLANKNLIICSEQSRYGGDGAGLKSITGGDTVNIDPKYRDEFIAVIQAMVMIVNNEATRFTERCGGIDRRRVIYCFDRVVPDEQRDPDLLAKIEQEISGVVYQLMQRFKDPMDAKRALYNQQGSEEALEVKSQTDHITEFCGYFFTSEQCNGLFVGNAGMFRAERTHLYPAYLAFTRAGGIKSELSLNNFAISLKQGLKQHGNKPDYAKKRTKSGFRTNVHFKDVEEFIKSFIK